ncbi:MAG: zinc-ribbon domain-containing protein [Myxococcota bacterium]
MIAGCPSCGARYRIDTAKLRPEGARLRCSRCETVFRVRPPQATPSVDETPAVASSPAPSPPTSEGMDGSRVVVVAHPDPEAGKSLGEHIEAFGLQPVVVHDGVDAVLQIQRVLPAAVVLDAALPKMFGFQICELMKRNSQLRSIPVVLVGAIHDTERYRRPAQDLYGADAYLERHELTERLETLLHRFGLELRTSQPSLPPAPSEPQVPAAPPQPSFEAPTPPPSEAPASSPGAPALDLPGAPEPTGGPELTGGDLDSGLDGLVDTPAPPPPPETPAPVAPAPTTESAVADAPGGDAEEEHPEVQKGLRLARIIVSDVILYNQETFEAALADGNVVAALSSELEEGYALFSQRVDTNICDPREFLQRELVRVARSRGMPE